mgnify:CR=1 FL=1
MLETIDNNNNIFSMHGDSFEMKSMKICRLFHLNPQKVWLGIYTFLLTNIPLKPTILRSFWYIETYSSN